MYTKTQILKQGTYKTGEVAKLLGMTTPTIIRYCEQGVIPFHKNQFGHRRIESHDLFDYLVSIGLGLDDSEDIKHDIIYARVSTYKQAQRGELDSQIDFLKLFAIEHNVKNLVIKKDIGSGLNDNRRQLTSLLKMIQDDKVNRVFITHKDKLARFGFNYIKRICDFHNVEIVIASEVENTKTESEELAKDIIALIHSFSGKLNGLQDKIKKGMEENDI